MPTWVWFPNLPLRYWHHICLSKITSMIGKPIQCDGPTAQMTWVSYARILIEIDLLSDLSSTVTVILPNGNTLVQQIVYKSFPRYCKQCKSLGHSTPSCPKGHTLWPRKRSHDTSASSASASPSAETAAVENQGQYCVVPSINPQEDPMSIEDATAGPLRTQSPGRKRPKLLVLSSLIHFPKRWVLHLHVLRGNTLHEVKQLPFLVWGRNLKTCWSFSIAT